MIKKLNKNKPVISSFDTFNEMINEINIINKKLKKIETILGRKDGKIIK